MGKRTQHVSGFNFVMRRIQIWYRFAKGLILDYWRSKGVMSRDASPQVEENLKEYIINAKLSGKPPEGKTWDDVDHVVNVYNCGSNILFAEIKWKRYSPNDHVNNTFIPTRILRKIYPLKVSIFFLSFSFNTSCS